MLLIGGYTGIQDERWVVGTNVFFFLVKKIYGNILPTFKIFNHIRIVAWIINLSLFYILFPYLHYLQEINTPS
jgi:hypothetical protein